MQQSFKSLNFSKEQQDDIIRVVCVVLLLGNIEFKQEEEKDTEVSNPQALQAAAKLFDVPADLLAKSLLQSEHATGRETFTVKHNPEKAADFRDALGKAIYTWLFVTLVSMINDAIQAKSNAKTLFIGALDIFGFEDFAVNSFEQFCINYANEKLQQFFNVHIFKMEQELYDREEIKWSHITFQDNQECLDLIAEKPPAILQILDEQCNLRSGTDEGFLEELHKAKATHKYYDKPKIAKKVFIIRHYAGAVEYTPAGFLDKNRSRLPPGVEAIVEASKFEFLKKIQGVSQSSETAPTTPAAASKAGHRPKMRQDSVASHFHVIFSTLSSQPCFFSLHLLPSSPFVSCR